MVENVVVAVGNSIVPYSDTEIRNTSGLFFDSHIPFKSSDIGENEKPRQYIGTFAPDLFD